MINPNKIRGIINRFKEKNEYTMVILLDLFLPRLPAIILLPVNCYLLFTREFDSLTIILLFLCAPLIISYLWRQLIVSVILVVNEGLTIKEAFTKRRVNVTFEGITFQMPFKYLEWEDQIKDKGMVRIINCVPFEALPSLIHSLNKKDRKHIVFIKTYFEEIYIRWRELEDFTPTTYKEFLKRSDLKKELLEMADDDSLLDLIQYIKQKLSDEKEAEYPPQYINQMVNEIKPYIKNETKRKLAELLE